MFVISEEQGVPVVIARNTIRLKQTDAVALEQTPVFHQNSFSCFVIISWELLNLWSNGVPVWLKILVLMIVSVLTRRSSGLLLWNFDETLYDRVGSQTNF